MNFGNTEEEETDEIADIIAATNKLRAQKIHLQELLEVQRKQFAHDLRSARARLTTAKEAVSDFEIMKLVNHSRPSQRNLYVPDPAHSEIEESNLQYEISTRIEKLERLTSLMSKRQKENKQEISELMQKASKRKNHLEDLVSENDRLEDEYSDLVTKLKHLRGQVRQLECANHEIRNERISKERRITEMALKADDIVTTAYRTRSKYC